MPDVILEGLTTLTVDSLKVSSLTDHWLKVAEYSLGECSLVLFLFQALTVNQIKKVRVLIDEKIIETKKEMEELEAARNFNMFQIGNLLHETVPVSDDEENNRVEKLFGDVKSRKKYSHVFFFI